MKAYFPGRLYVMAFDFLCVENTTVWLDMPN